MTGAAPRPERPRTCGPRSRIRGAAMLAYCAPSNKRRWTNRAAARPALKPGRVGSGWGRAAASGLEGLVCIFSRRRTFGAAPAAPRAPPQTAAEARKSCGRDSGRSWRRLHGRAGSGGRTVAVRAGAGGRTGAVRAVRARASGFGPFGPELLGGLGPAGSLQPCAVRFLLCGGSAAAHGDSVLMLRS